MGCQASLVRHSRPKGGATDRPSRIATIEGLNGANPARERSMGEVSKGPRLVRASSEWATDDHGDSVSQKPDWAREPRDLLSGLTSRTAVYVIRTYGDVGGPPSRGGPIPIAKKDD
jgi:hypothetical protein